MTRMSGHRGVTRWLRARGPRADAAPIDVPVAAGTVIVLPPEEQRALDWDARPTAAERERITITLDPKASDTENARNAERQLAQQGVGATVTVAPGTPHARKRKRSKR